MEVGPFNKTNDFDEAAFVSSHHQIGQGVCLQGTESARADIFQYRLGKHGGGSMAAPMKYSRSLRYSSK